MKLAKTLAGVFLGFAALVNVANAEPIEIKFGHINQPGSLIDNESQEFAKRANAKLGDKAKVVVYNAAQLGNDKDQVKPPQARHAAHRSPLFDHDLHDARRRPL